MGLKQQDAEVKMDFKVLRDMIAQQQNNDVKSTPRPIVTDERECLVEHVEEMKEQIKRHDREIQATKEKVGELQTECDFYKDKLQRLNPLPNNLLARLDIYNVNVDSIRKENRKQHLFLLFRRNSNPKTNRVKKDKPQKVKSKAAKAANHIEVDLPKALRAAKEKNRIQAQKIMELKQQDAKGKLDFEMEVTKALMEANEKIRIQAQENM
uniref:coiled-coil domain-containing protein 149-like n=1 Tax=Myxine glutinosa TaxID=7769 RepID=UPI00358F49DC